MRFLFIDEYRDEFPVSDICEVLDVSTSGYYAWRERAPSAREIAIRELGKKIEAVYNESNGTHGSPRVYRELRTQGVACSENRVARLMKLHRLKAKQVRRYKATTRRNKSHRAARTGLSVISVCENRTEYG